MADAPRAYIEHDGRVYTVVREGRRTLPGVDEVDVPFEERGRVQLGPHDVVMGSARLTEHPKDWVLKDDVPLMDDAAPVLRAAVLGSLYRPVVGAVLLRERTMLLVKPSRGVAAGRWTLPGGFMEPFESPEEAVRREVAEETGLEVGELDMLGVWLHREHVLQFPIMGLAFVGHEVAGEVHTNPDEIREVRWMPLDEVGGNAMGLAREVMDQWGERIRGLA